MKLKGASNEVVGGAVDGMTKVHPVGTCPLYRAQMAGGNEDVVDAGVLGGLVQMAPSNLVPAALLEEGGGHRKVVMTAKRQ